MSPSDDNWDDDWDYTVPIRFMFTESQWKILGPVYTNKCPCCRQSSPRGKECPRCREGYADYWDRLRTMEAERIKQIEKQSALADIYNAVGDWLPNDEEVNKMGEQNADSNSR